jgi:hypothetical protein
VPISSSCERRALILSRPGSGSSMRGCSAVPLRRRAWCRGRLDFPDSGRDRQFCDPEQLSSTGATFALGGPDIVAVVVVVVAPVSAASESWAKIRPIAAIESTSKRVDKREPPSMNTSLHCGRNTDHYVSRRKSFQSDVASDMISLEIQARVEACSHSSVAQWQSIRLLTGGL